MARVESFIDHMIPSSLLCFVSLTKENVSKTFFMLLLLILLRENGRQTSIDYFIRELLATQFDPILHLQDICLLLQLLQDFFLHFRSLFSL